MTTATVEVKSKTIGGVRLYYVYCNNCKKWVKSNYGQFVWETRTQPRQVQKQHKCNGEREMGRSFKTVEAVGLRSIGKSMRSSNGLQASSSVTDGPVNVVSRSIRLEFTESDVDFMLSFMAADDNFAEKMKKLLAERDSYLAEIEDENTPVVRRVNIKSNLSGHLKNVL